MLSHKLPLGAGQSCFSYFSSVGSPAIHPYKVTHHLQGSFQPHCNDYHTYSLPPRCYPSYREVDTDVPWGATMALQHPVTACSNSNPQIHLGHARHQLNSSVMLTTNTQDEKLETGSTWHIGHHLTYCTSPR